MSDILLQAENVGIRFGGLQALEALNLTVRDKELCCIIGPNGAGKSTFLYVVGGMIRPDAGRVVLDGVDITDLPLHKRAQRGLVRTFQISRELGGLTVLENLLFARPDQSGESIWKNFALYPRVRNEEAEAIRHACEVLERVGLRHLADNPARALSGGQKKLLELCRALMLRPKIILLDEPGAGVSPPMRVQISDVIKSLRDEGITFVIIEHDMDMIARLCDHVYVFAEGTNLTDGSFSDIIADRRVIDAYLGGMN
jgi:ABC-type branched-subunit amino acid transport system ATPase component